MLNPVCQETTTYNKHVKTVSLFKVGTFINWIVIKIILVLIRRNIKTLLCCSLRFV